MLKRLIPMGMLALLTFSTAGAAGDDTWKKLTSLSGEWQGTAEGRTTTVTYTLVSGGNALMESMKMPAPEPDMVTVYHRDGDGFVATHYCSIGNQPRMRSKGLAADGKSIPFRFADITNLKPGGHHIKHLTVRFIDQNTFAQEWTSQEGDKESKIEFKWTRTKK